MLVYVVYCVQNKLSSNLKIYLVLSLLYYLLFFESNRSKNKNTIIFGFLEFLTKSCPFPYVPFNLLMQFFMYITFYMCAILFYEMQFLQKMFFFFFFNVYLAFFIITLQTLYYSKTPKIQVDYFALSYFQSVFLFFIFLRDFSLFLNLHS